MRVLVVAEKDIAARRIAKILSDDGARTKKLGKVNSYELNDGTHEYTVIGLRGHIVEVDYPKEFNRWSMNKLRDLVWAEPMKKVDKAAKPIGDALQKLAKKHQRVVLATDYDREGELIGVEALALVREGNPDIDVKRARFSALTKDEVTRAFNELTSVDDNLAASAEARQIVDLAWGATLTRFVSLAAGQMGKDFLSVGRVQSPTLALIVDKEKEIQAFVPTPYWEVTGQAAADGAEFPIGHDEGRFWEEQKALAAHENAVAADAGTVTAVERSQRTERAPPPFNTTSFLRAATALGFSASRAMSVAEDLYTNGWISYPRTDNTVYPPSLDLREVLDIVAKGGPWKEEAQKLQARSELTPTRGKKTSTDHPPIHPTELAKKTDLGKDEWRVYELVVRRFLATLSDSAVVENLKVRLEVGGEPFNATGRRLVEPGFRAVYTYSRGEDVLLPEMQEGNTVRVLGVEVLAKETQPPRRYSQGRLIQEMESLGLGTKSTRAEIIQKLYSRDFVRKNPPEPTPTGFAVMDTLERYAEAVARPDMTAKLEEEMEEIAQGNLDLPKVVQDSRQMLSEIYDTLEHNRPHISTALRKAMLEKNTVGACPNCEEKLVIRRSRKGKRFVGCIGFPQCETTYPLPQRGAIEPLQEQCPQCAAPVIKVMGKGRPWITCLTMDCKGMEQARIAAAQEKEEDASASGDGDEGFTEPTEVDPEDLEA